MSVVNHPIAPALYRWLTSPQATPWLEIAASQQTPLHARAVALRRDLTAEQTHLVLEQAELRARAAIKFEDADRMFFAPQALEQATDQFVAGYKALRLPPGKPVADLCCGIGGDLLAIAGRGDVWGVERVPSLAILAKANCRVARPSGEVHVQVGDAREVDLVDITAWHIDPDRRPSGRRTTAVELHEPDALAIERMLAKNPSAAIKLAPAARLPDDWFTRAELEWIGRARQCRQLVAWFGSLAEIPGQRRATVLGAQGELQRTFTGDPAISPASAKTIGRYIFEPDAALLAAGLTGAIAANHDLSAVARSVAYLTGDVLIEDPALAAFEVSEVLPYQVKRLKQLLRARGIGRLEIKKRGVPYDPDVLRKKLQVPGECAATLLLARIEGKITAIIARRLGHEDVWP